MDIFLLSYNETGDLKHLAEAITMMMRVLMVCGLVIALAVVSIVFSVRHRRQESAHPTETHNAP